MQSKVGPALVQALSQGTRTPGQQAREGSVTGRSTSSVGGRTAGSTRSSGSGEVPHRPSSTSGPRLLASITSVVAGSTAHRQRMASASRSKRAAALLVSSVAAEGAGAGSRALQRAAPAHHHRAPQIQPVPTTTRRGGARSRSARAQLMASQVAASQGASVLTMPSGRLSSSNSQTQGRHSAVSTTAAWPVFKRMLHSHSEELGNDAFLAAVCKQVHVCSWETYFAWLQWRSAEAGLRHLVSSGLSAPQWQPTSLEEQPVMTQVDLVHGVRSAPLIELAGRTHVRGEAGAARPVWAVHCMAPHISATNDHEYKRALQSFMLAPSTPESLTSLDLSSDMDCGHGGHPELVQRILSTHKKTLSQGGHARGRYRFANVPCGLPALKQECLGQRWREGVREGLQQDAADNAGGVSASCQGQLNRETRRSDEDAVVSEKPATSHGGEADAAAQGRTTAVDGLRETKLDTAALAATAAPASTHDTRMTRQGLTTAATSAAGAKPLTPASGAAAQALPSANQAIPVADTKAAKRKKPLRSTKYCELCRVEYEVVGGDRGEHFRTPAHQARLRGMGLSRVQVGQVAHLTSLAATSWCEPDVWIDHAPGTAAVYTAVRWALGKASSGCAKALAGLVQRAGLPRATAEAVLTGSSEGEFPQPRDESVQRVCMTVQRWMVWARKVLLREGPAPVPPFPAAGLAASLPTYVALLALHATGSGPHPASLLQALGCTPSEPGPVLSEGLNAVLAEHAASRASDKLSSPPRCAKVSSPVVLRLPPLPASQGDDGKKAGQVLSTPSPLGPPAAVEPPSTTSPGQTTEEHPSTQCRDKEEPKVTPARERGTKRRRAPEVSPAVLSTSTEGPVTRSSAKRMAVQVDSTNLSGVSRSMHTSPPVASAGRARVSPGGGPQPGTELTSRATKGPRTAPDAALPEQPASPARTTYNAATSRTNRRTRRFGSNLKSQHSPTTAVQRAGGVAPARTNTTPAASVDTTPSVTRSTGGSAALRLAPTKPVGGTSAVRVVGGRKRPRSSATRTTARRRSVKEADTGDAFAFHSPGSENAKGGRGRVGARAGTATRRMRAGQLSSRTRVASATATRSQTQGPAAKRTKQQQTEVDSSVVHDEFEAVFEPEQRRAAPRAGKAPGDLDTPPPGTAVGKRSILTSHPRTTSVSTDRDLPSPPPPSYLLHGTPTSKGGRGSSLPRRSPRRHRASSAESARASSLHVAAVQSARKR